MTKKSPAGWTCHPKATKPAHYYEYGQALAVCGAIWCGSGERIAQSQFQGYKCPSCKAWVMGISIYKEPAHVGGIAGRTDDKVQADDKGQAEDKSKAE